MSSPNTIVKHPARKGRNIFLEETVAAGAIGKILRNSNANRPSKAERKDLFRTTMKRKSRTQKNKAESDLVVACCCQLLM
jgi:hypothetical protein